jgi:hypothetical protein
MKLMHASGLLFRDIFYSVFGTYRTSDARIEWARVPGNPNQRAQEDPEFVQALYGAAAQHYMDHHRVKPSVKQLHDFMLERAEMYPCCMLLLHYSRFVEIQKMMKMSEKEGDRGDVDLFISSLKLSLPLFATTHKIDYVKVACNFLVNWELDSPALKAIYRRFLFTQLGPTGYATELSRLEKARYFLTQMTRLDVAASL